MDTELLQALGAEVRELLDTLRVEVRREFAEQLLAMQGTLAEEVTVLRARLVEADHRHELVLRDLEVMRVGAADPDAIGARMAELAQVQRAAIEREFAEQLAGVARGAANDAAMLREQLAEANHRAELAQRDLDAVRDFACAPVVAFARDATGVLSLVQRNGPAVPLPLPDFEAVARSLVEALGVALRETLTNEQQAQIARTFELFCNAPTWSETAMYTEGQIVQTDIGRTYRVRKGVKATTRNVPGDDPEHWERLGTIGFRVLKSRPEALAPGDLFTEHDARFLHDGRATVLFVPKAPKSSDIERAVRAPQALAEAAQQATREQAAQTDALRIDVARSTKAANDAGELSAQALAEVEALRRDFEARHANPADDGGDALEGAA